MRTVLSTIRVLISSPGDVEEERERARQVVEGLRRRYAGSLRIEALLWESMPLQADAPFQKGIEAELDGEPGIDIAVIVLWSRLGTPLGPQFHDQGGASLSGTEREFELMLEACRRSGGVRPSILVYTRTDEASFEERLRGRPTAEKAAMVAQKQAVEKFIAESLHSRVDGTNFGAYHKYDRPIAFSDRLRAHLTTLLDGLAGRGQAEPLWDCDREGPPFMGLEAFQVQHANVFAGREGDILETRLALREQARGGCAFVLLSGASGSGKSSLARAGVIPCIMENELDDEVSGWRLIAVTPSELAPDPFFAMACRLAVPEILPHLHGQPDAIRSLADGLRHAPAQAIRLSLRQGLKRPGPQTGGSLRILLLVDQLEELLGTAHFNDQDRREFFVLIEALARSGCAWVIATVRSDFLGQVQCQPAMEHLLEGRALLTVRPPNDEALRRIIEEPARFAGLVFEQRRERSLAEQILKDALERSELLPLLEFVLRELFEQREQQTLRWKTYEELGGVEGALARCAEQTFSRLPADSQAALDEVLQAVVTVGEGAAGSDGEVEERLARQRAPMQTFASRPPARHLIEVFAAERLFTIDAHPQSGEPTFTVAHEALLRVWRRAAAWAVRNHDFLLVRARVAARLQEGSPILEGDPLLELARTHLSHKEGEGFTHPQVEFIEACLTRARYARQRRERLRRRVMVGLAVLAAVAVMMALVATAQMRESRRLQQLAVQQKKFSDELFSQSVRDVDNVQTKYVKGTLVDMPGLDDQQLDELQSEHRRLTLTHLQDLQNRNPEDAQLALLLAKTLIEQSQAEIRGEKSADAEQHLQAAIAIVGPKSTVLPEGAESYATALLERARIFSYQQNMKKAGEIARENRPIVQSLVVRWPNSWRLQYLLSRLDNLLILANSPSREAYQRLAERLRSVIEASNHNIDPVGWYFVAAYDAANTGFVRTRERYDEMAGLLGFYRTNISEFDGYGAIELREAAGWLKLDIDTLRVQFSLPNPSDTVQSRKTILTEAEKIVGRLEDRLPRNQTVTSLRGSLLEMQRFAARDKANTRNAAELAAASDRHRVEATQAGETSGAISTLALALASYTDALVILDKPEAPKSPPAAPQSPDVLDPFASVDKARRDAVSILAQNADAPRRELALKTKKQVSAVIEGLGPTVQRFSFYSTKALFENNEVPAGLNRLRERKRRDTVLERLRSFQVQYIRLFEKQNPFVRLNFVSQVIGSTQSELTSWFEEGRDKELIEFWEKALADLPMDDQKIPESSGLIDVMSLTARTDWRSGRAEEANTLVAQARAICAQGLKTRKWDWYLRGADIHFCFDCAEALSAQGRTPESQDLLREAWTRTQERFGGAIDLRKFASLPLKGKLPAGMKANDKDAVLFRLYLPLGQGGSSFKTFMIPCEVLGEKVPIEFFILHGQNGYAGLVDQFRWLREFRNVDVPADVADSLRKLNDIAIESHFDFQDLCTYALNYNKNNTAKTPGTR